MKTKQPIEINLEAVEINELSVFLQQGARGIPEFAASCTSCPPSYSYATMSCAACPIPPDAPGFKSEE